MYSITILIETNWSCAVVGAGEEGGERRHWISDKRNPFIEIIYCSANDEPHK